MKGLLLGVALTLVLVQEVYSMVNPERVFSDPHAVALAGAVAKGDVETVRHLLASGVDARAKGASGMTLTHFALYAKANGPDVLKLLLHAGADPISRLEDKNDVPHYAAARDDADPAFLAVLLDAGVSPSLVGGGENNSLLDAAVSGRNEAVVKLLLARGADVNYNHPFSGTALHTAVNISDYRIATLLLNHGANPLLRNKQSPLIDRDVPKRTPAEIYCIHNSGRNRYATPRELAEFNEMKEAFARRGVILPCGI